MISSTPSLFPIVAEPRGEYGDPIEGDRWVKVLLNYSREESTSDLDSVKLFTYRVPPNLDVNAGDVVLVPSGSTKVGGIVMWELKVPDLEKDRIKDIESVTLEGAFNAHYWKLLERVARYYFVPLITVARIALPPGLLPKTQSRVRLLPNAIPQGFEVFCSEMVQTIIVLLKSQKEGDYSTRHIYQKLGKRRRKAIDRGLRDLKKRGWIKQYLEVPDPPRPKMQKAVTLISDIFSLNLTERQQEVLKILRNEGGEMWVKDCKKEHNISSSILRKLEEKGHVIIQDRENLRFLVEPDIVKNLPKILNTDQAKALEAIKNCTGFAQILLHGVTGSGKTEVYLQAIASILEQRKSVLILIPEIGLAPQLRDRLYARFGDKVYVYHSNLSKGERYDTWRFILFQEPLIFLGTRSHIFAPIFNLGLIILDEEHDHSFKQDQRSPHYHARKIAQWRARAENCPLILGSATPSLETWHTHHDRPNSDPSLLYLSLPHRIHSRPLPPVEVVDMRKELKQGNRSIFSVALQNALKQLKQTGNKGILFVPRRGHGTFVSCRSCGYVIYCPHCDVSLSYHHVNEDAKQILRCHYCGYHAPYPSQCPQCNSPYIKFFGTGTQKVVREIERNFPDLRVMRFDRDETGGKNSHRDILERFATGNDDILVGTQMLTKGLDIAKVTLVGILAADGLLHLSDYYASERAFQTLTQVAGRAGRGDDPGRVILQTYTPDHPVIEAVRNHDYLTFARETLLERSQLNYPPYGRLILLRLSGLDGEEVAKAANLVAQGCQTLLTTIKHELLGPAPASIMRIDRRYRWQILLKFPLNVENLPDLAQLKKLCPQPIRLTIDVDPLSIS
ncbi:MAG: primosomal protein N' [Cyanobacteria bacterium SBLK]|nr:primosomal protein N' [Cyanobacteria bacterium SBLK]